MVIFRWLLAAGCFAFCVKQMATALKAEGLGAAPFLVLGFTGLLAAVLLVSPEIVIRPVEFFSRIFTTIILPDEKYRRPPLSYLLARRYARQLRFREALEEYEKILRFYPNEEDAFRELIAAALEAGAVRLAGKYTRLYERRFGRELPPPALPESQADR